MNISHLKYIVEVEKTGSITKAALNLFMGQPNLSKALKELENEIGITIFKRTAKGVVPTQKGCEFLSYAKSILAQLSEMESLYKPANNDVITFDISIPRASYISHAFAKFASELDMSKQISLNYKETNSIEAINNVVEHDTHLGIIRCQNIYEQYFLSLLAEKDLDYKLIWEFEYVLIFSKNSLLANLEKIPFENLYDYIEIVHGDLSVPSLSLSQIQKNSPSEYHQKRIFVYERGGQFDFLNDLTNTYMWVSPLPQTVLDRYGLVQKKCDISYKINKDFLIFPKNYKFTQLDEKFISDLEIVKIEVSHF